jgi:hypothetical protein
MERLTGIVTKGWPGELIVIVLLYVPVFNPVTSMVTEILEGVVPLAGLMASQDSPEVEAVKFSGASVLVTEIAGCGGGNGPLI